MFPFNFACHGPLPHALIAVSVGLSFGLRDHDLAHEGQDWLDEKADPPEHFNAIDWFKDKHTGLSCIHPPLCFGKDYGTQNPLDFSVDADGANCIVKGQGACNNCYAHAVSGMISDRMCIYKVREERQRITPELLRDTLMSPQDLTSCGGGNGCEAGPIQNSIHVAVEQVANYGIASYDCMPYWSWEGMTGECPDRCRDGSPKVHNKPSRPYFHNIARKLRKRPNHHKWLLYKSGPLVAGFDFPPDFKTFLFDGPGKNGRGDVYIPTETMDIGSAKTAHAVKIIGWGSQMQAVDGTEVKVPYWLCQNSWGPDGVGDARAPFFKVIREAEGQDIMRVNKWGEHVPLLPYGVTMNIESSMYAIDGPFTSTADNEWVQGSYPVQETIFSVKGAKNKNNEIWANYAEAMCTYYGPLKIWDVGCEEWLEKTTKKEVMRLCRAYGLDCPSRSKKSELVQALTKHFTTKKDLSYKFEV